MGFDETLLEGTGLAGSSIIATSESWIVDDAVRQVERVGSLPGVTGAIGMPDLHPGRDAPIGVAVLTDGVLYPHLVGSDIGCGMGAWVTDLPARAMKLDKIVRRLRHLDEPWGGDRLGWLAEDGVVVGGRDAIDTALGTIGGGNHFAEIQAIEEIVDERSAGDIGLDRDRLVLTVHSGSRGLGEAILRAHKVEHDVEGVQATSDAGRHYLERHDHAVAWARSNRRLIAHRVLDALNVTGKRVIDICHNSVTAVPDADSEHRWIHRKGAAPGDVPFVVIPGSRGAHSYIVAATGASARSGWSIAHGAGRKWSRNDARSRIKARFSVDDLERTPLGSRVICENRQLLFEEAPPAYKSIERVVGDLVEHGLVRVVARLRPLVSYKTRREEQR